MHQLEGKLNQSAQDLSARLLQPNQPDPVPMDTPRKRLKTSKAASATSKPTKAPQLQRQQSATVADARQPTSTPAADGSSTAPDDSPITALDVVTSSAIASAEPDGRVASTTEPESVIPAKRKAGTGTGSRKAAEPKEAKVGAPKMASGLLTKPKKLKAHTLQTQTYQIPIVERHADGKPVLPLKSGVLTLHKLGCTSFTC